MNGKKSWFDVVDDDDVLLLLLVADAAVGIDIDAVALLLLLLLLLLAVLCGEDEDTGEAEGIAVAVLEERKKNDEAGVDERGVVVEGVVVVVVAVLVVLLGVIGSGDADERIDSSLSLGVRDTVPSSSCVGVEFARFFQREMRDMVGLDLERERASKRGESVVLTTKEMKK
jgi:hypothetical protein